MPPTRFTLDLHLHSRYSRGTSPALNLAVIARGARLGGIDIAAAPDFTHPAWLEEMSASLTEAADGLYAVSQAGSSAFAAPSDSLTDRPPPLFMLVTEISCVWTGQGRGRRVHLLVTAPDLAAVNRINRSLGRKANLASDGRPLINLPAREVAEMVWSAAEHATIVPAHIWTPWYGLLGSKSGFDSIEECFGDLAPRIKAIETGLSSDPAMNWRVASLDGRAIVSFSDAHSAPAMGREATVVRCEPDYAGITAALEGAGIVETLEFHPEHGKYHLDGHRKCGVRMTPAESASARGRCPVCGRPLTLGVLNRVNELAGRPEAGPRPDDAGLISGPPGRPPYRYILPLRELLSQALGAGPGSGKVARTWEALVLRLGGEIAVLTAATHSEITRIAGESAASYILGARAGNVEIDPGYDGEYGQVKVAPGRSPGLQAERQD